jgi:SAM-dependent methyltransferase
VSTAAPTVDAGPAAPACEACGRTTQAWRIAPGNLLWRCGRCGHVLRDLALAPARHRGHAWGGDGGFDRIRSSLTMRSLRRAAPATRAGPSSILEIGFGRGMLLTRFLEQGHDVSGIDPGMLERDLDPELVERATLHAEPVESVELAQQAFDLIYGIHVIEHLKDPAAVFRACYGALRPGGVLYLMTPNARSSGLTLFRESWWNLEDPTHIRFFSPASVAMMLRDAGFPGGRVRIPIWDSLTLEISSLLREFVREPGEHGILAVRGTRPVYAALLPAAAVGRAIWPRLSPSIEIVARKHAEPPRAAVA